MHLLGSVGGPHPTQVGTMDAQEGQTVRSATHLPRFCGALHCVVYIVKTLDDFLILKFKYAFIQKASP